jgi:uncharacterized protein (DUF2236 family)
VNPGSSAAVDRAGLERELALLRASTADPRAGIFGPASMIWRIDRESALFLGASCAALLQAAHPWVAAAVSQHGSVTQHPIARFQRTFTTVFSMVFGTLEQALDAARALHALHSRIVGWVPATSSHDPERYEANRISALAWVQATLLDTALKAYELICPPLGAEEKERYYRESILFAKLFGLAEEDLPPSWAAFQDYYRRVTESDILRPIAASRELGELLLRGRRAGRLPLLVPAGYRALTISLLPPRVRAVYGLDFGPREALLAERAARTARRIYPRLPEILRFVPPYHEAVLRLRGAGRPGMAVRLLNRVWIGRSTLVS